MTACKQKLSNHTQADNKPAARTTFPPLTVRVVRLAAPEPAGVRSRISVELG